MDDSKIVGVLHDTDILSQGLETDIRFEQMYMKACDTFPKEAISMNRSRIYSFIKRSSDIIFSFLALLFLTPLFFVVAFLIKYESDGSVFFTQMRVGKNGKLFKMYKFRSMVKNAEDLKHHLHNKNEMDGPMFKMKDDPRVTDVGKFIRKTSIDELPQLINVLLGQMSLVGPRPNLPDEVINFDDWHMLKLATQPGLTCYWQVSGRNNIDFEQWMDLDITYNQQRNLRIDAKLILKTALLLLGDKHAC